jgi:LPS-assembly protein
MRRVLGTVSLVALLCAGAWPLTAQERATDEPVVLTADEVSFDEALGLVIASGRVEIIQASRVLRADRVTYNQRTDVVAASGNVVLVQDTGEVMFADYAELQGDLAEGFVEKVAILLSDDSRLIANSGVRREGRITEVDRAVYSPCALCEEDPRRAPLWQLRAVTVTHDAEAKDVIYHDAFLDFFGIPVLYTPYFSHPDPSVERRQGFLPPEFGTTADLGPFFNAIYYWDIDPWQDATTNFGLTRDKGFLLGGEYRRRFENGALRAEGSVNRSDLVEDTATGQEEKDDQLRGHIFAEALFDLDEHWRAGFDFNRTSDDTYLEVFDISGEDVLESRGYVEGFYGLSYTSAEVYDFQDLRPDSIDPPTILPWLNGNWVGDPGAVLGGQLAFDASAINIMRDADIGATLDSPTEGVDTRRLSLDGRWQREDIYDNGLVTEMSAGVRGDLYWSDDLPDPNDPADTRSDVFATRLYPRANLTARYPLVRQSGGWQQLIEPIASVTAAADTGDDHDIPNNDSQDVEFDEINLFSDNRFPGLDRVENGLRFTYGLQMGLFDTVGGSSTLFVGQSIRLAGDDDFPEGSGLEDDFSDFVGRLTVMPNEYLNLDYRFRFDAQNLDPRRQEVALIAGVDLFRVGANYTAVDSIAGTGTGEDVQEIAAAVSSHFSDYWTATASIRRDLEANETRRFTAGLFYEDECFTFGVDFRRDFTSDRDLESGDSIFVVLSLRNLGEAPVSVRPDSLFR